MKVPKLALLSMLLLLALVAVGCGGDSEEVPADAIAVVDGTDVEKSEFDALIAQAKKSYSLQKREFPKAGSPEYNTLKNQAVQFLVQRTQFELQAEELDVEVTEKQVNDRLAQIKKQYFGGSDKKYQDQLKQQGLTEEQVKRDIRAQLIQEGIFKQVTEDVKITDKEIQEYYNENKSQFGTPEQRDVRHILVPTKKQADDLYAQLQDGANFAALAKKFSKDPASASQGGKLTIARGQTVPTFDQTAFLLAKNTISRPVKTQYGYHIIEPLSEIKPAKTTPLNQVKDSIRQQLLQTRRNEAMTKWVEETKKDFEEKTNYQVGFTPPKTSSTTTTGATTTAG
ncbi:MAG TPA: peptidylprolyl isomerase [Gaiellaceae bacterium]|nr:peptidylprolyl isomerase [Gaiellaceae bacterium]